MQGKATIADHPIHPMLVAFPVGFFGGAAVCDIISIWAGPAFWPRMAVALIAFGVIAALLAAVFGFVDYFTAPMNAQTKRTATTHMVLNLIVVVLYLIAYFVRAGDPISTLGYALSFIGLAVLVTSGWYGGHLSYVEHVGATEERTQTLR